jgi:hypothetical protein
MARNHTPPASIEIRSALAREALVSYKQWRDGDPLDPERPASPEVMGKMAGALELLLGLIQEWGIKTTPDRCRSRRRLEAGSVAQVNLPALRRAS